MERFYLDTSIWLDFYEKRGTHGEHAFQVLQKILLEDYVIFISDVIVKELKGLGYSPDQIEEMFTIAKPDHLVKVHLNKKQLVEAKVLARKRNIPCGDALHAILARDHEAILLSRDHDFQRLKDITRVELPENFI